MRTLLGGLLIKAGMAILPKDVRKMVRDILLYHVPGGITGKEKADVAAAKKAWSRSR